MNNYSDSNTQLRQVQPQSPSASHEYVVVPIVELVRRWLLQFEPGELITTTVRKLSDDIGAGQRAWGSITPALKKLQRDGFLSYTAARGEGTVIQRLGIDRPVDQGEASFSALPREIPDRVADHVSSRKAADRDVDQALCMEDHDLYTCMQQQDARARENETSEQPQRPEWYPSGHWQRCVKIDSTFTPQRAQELLTKIATRHQTPHHVRSPFGLIESHLRTGEPILSLDEIHAQASQVAALFGKPAPDAPSVAPERPPRRRREQASHTTQSKPATNADEEAERRRAYVEGIAPDADDDAIDFLLGCYDRGLRADQARAELEAAYVNG